KYETMRKNREQGNSGNAFSRESNLRNSRLDSGTTGSDQRDENFEQQRRDNRRNADFEGYDNHAAEYDAPFNNRRTEEDWWPGSREESQRYRHDAEAGNARGYQSEGGPWYDRDRMSDRSDWRDYQNLAGRWNDRGSWDPRSNWNREQGKQWNDNSRWYPEGEWRNMQDQDTWNNSFQSKGRGEGYSLNEYYGNNRRDNYSSPSYRGNSRQDMGQHRGKGPKGYTRSDERIVEDINDRLTDDSYVDAENIEVGVNGGEVVLS